MPIYVPGKVVLRKELPADAEADAYIAAVEAADGQALEPGVKFAIKNFVLCCKADGIWSAIKASCILAGARTLNGALVPLVGAAPTNVNFVAGDYNRETGLAGDGSTKYLNSNRSNNADPQNSKHLAVYASFIGTNISGWNSYIGALPSSGDGRSDLELTGSGGTINAHINLSGNSAVSGSSVAGFIGAQRPDSSTTILRMASSSTTASRTSMTPYNGNIFVFARNLNNAVNQHINARLAFYSIGESLNLALLDARVTDLVNAFAAAIP